MKSFSLTVTENANSTLWRITDANDCCLTVPIRVFFSVRALVEMIVPFLGIERRNCQFQLELLTVYEEREANGLEVRKAAEFKGHGCREFARRMRNADPNRHNDRECPDRWSQPTLLNLRDREDVTMAKKRPDQP